MYVHCLCIAATWVMELRMGMVYTIQATEIGGPKRGHGRSVEIDQLRCFLSIIVRLFIVLIVDRD